MISFDEACRYLEDLPTKRLTERIPLDQAHGRTLAKPVIAQRSAPSTPVSAMDGYAVRDSDIESGVTCLRVVGQSFAGDAARRAELEPGCCVRILTGAPAPYGADRVVIQEEVVVEDNTVVLSKRPSGNRHIRAEGSDFRRGEALLAAGARLTPQAMVLAAAADLSHLEAFARPSVSILSTGDELAGPGSARDRPGAIPESISFGVAGLVHAWGGKVVARRRVRDDLPTLFEAAKCALDEAQVVVVTGGASVGERDFGKAAFEPAGLELVFSKVAIKPGKPVWLGLVGDRIVVGLPGNPSAALTTARLFLAPLLASMSGGGMHDAWIWRTAPLAASLERGGDRECFYRARGGARGVTPFADQDSSSQKGLAAADLLIRLRRGAPALDVGDLVEVLAL